MQRKGYLKRRAAAAVAAFVLIAAAALPAGGTALASDFTDVGAGYWASEDVQAGTGLGLLNGYPDGSFRPDATIRRAEFAAMLVRALGLTAPGAPTKTFADVPQGSWAYSAVEAAAQAGIVNGYPDGTFRPDAPVTREEMAAMIARGFGDTVSAPASVPLSLQSLAPKGPSSFRDLPASSFGAGAAAKLGQLGIITGYPDGTFHPNAHATRAEAAAMLMRAIESQYAVGDPFYNGGSWVKVQDGAKTRLTPAGGPAVFTADQLVELFWLGTQNKVDDATLEKWLEGVASPEVARALIQWRDSWGSEVYLIVPHNMWDFEGPSSAGYFPVPLFYGLHYAAVRLSVNAVHGTGDPLGTVRWDRTGQFDLTFYLKRQDLQSPWKVVGVDAGALPVTALAQAPGWHGVNWTSAPTSPLSFETHLLEYTVTMPDGRTLAAIAYTLPEQFGWPYLIKGNLEGFRAFGYPVHVVRIGGVPAASSPYASDAQAAEAATPTEPSGSVLVVVGSLDGVTAEVYLPTDPPVSRAESLLEELTSDNQTVGGGATILAVGRAPWERVAGDPVWQDMLRYGVTTTNAASILARVAGLAGSE